MMLPKWRFARKTEPCFGGHAAHATYVMPEPGKHAPGRVTFVCSSCQLPTSARMAPMVICSAGFFDARQYAQSAFQCDADALDCEETEEQAEVLLRWEGTDAGAYPNRRLVVVSQRIELATDRGTLT